MGKLRITAANTFALEMVRAALQHESIPRGYQLNGMWMHMDMEAGNDYHKYVTLVVKIYGASSQVRANCQVASEDGAWVRGTCQIDLVDDPTQSWKFTCEVTDNIITATPTPAPQASV